MRHLAGGLVVWMGMCAGHAWGQQGLVAAGLAHPTADEIAARMMAKNAERQAELQSWTSERTYRVEYHGVGGAHEGEIEVKAEYVDGHKRLTVVSESGSKVICERVLRKMVESEQEAAESSNRMQTALTPANYNLELVGEETVDGVRAWVLHVSPRVDNKFLYRGRVWVSEDSYATVKVGGEPAKNPSWWINRASFDWRYGRHGRFWLPERTEAVSHVRIGGEAKLTIEYGEYRIVSERQGGVELAQHTAR